MRSIATGIDLVEIRRLEAIDPAIKSRFLKRVFTDRELDECAGKDIRLAARFAAKEAAAKALGCGIGKVSWQELEILTEENGRPVLRFHGEASRLAAELGWSDWSVSLSHTSDYAVACVTGLIESV